MATIPFRLELDHNVGSVRAALKEMESSIDFTDVAREGIEAMALGQIGQAPIGEGPGVHGSIPRSIDTQVYPLGGGSAVGRSRTNEPRAVFTNVGTGTHGPEGKEYFIPRPDWGEGRGIWHPGIKGTHWWERGANTGSPVALAAFRRKVSEIMTLRGLR